MPRLGNKSDKGAIAALFAIFMGTGMLILLLGLVLDGGLLFNLRTSLQNSVDEFSSSTSELCATSVPGSDCLSNNIPSISSTFNQTGLFEERLVFEKWLLNGNSKNFSITNKCGVSSIWASMPTCPPLTGNPRDCQSDLQSLGEKNWVRVYGSTDPSGYEPFFANFLSSGNSKFAEYACSQFYWGQGGAIPKILNTSQIPFAIGICDALNATSNSIVQLVGDNPSSVACPKYYDRQNRKYAGGVGTYPGATAASPKTNGTVNGFIAWKTYNSASSGCWTLNATCVNSPLSQVRTDSAPYPKMGYSYSSMVQTVMKNSLGKSFLLPVVDKNSLGAYVVRSYVPFTLLGYRMTSTSSLSSANAQKSFTDKSGTSTTISWGAACPTPTTTSASCIAGIISPRVYAPYDTYSGISLTTDAGVPDFGYYIQRQAP